MPLSPEELQDTIFAKNFGTATGLELRPNGYFYFLRGIREVEGKIYRIMPIMKVSL